MAQGDKAKAAPAGNFLAGAVFWLLRDRGGLFPGSLDYLPA